MEKINFVSENFFQTDLSNKEDINKMVEDIIKKHGRVDVLVNNTGGPKAGFFDEISDDDWVSIRFSSGEPSA